MKTYEIHLDCGLNGLNVQTLTTNLSLVELVDDLEIKGNTVCSVIGDGEVLYAPTIDVGNWMDMLDLYH